MARDTDLDWQQLARQEPYWGVLSAEDFTRKNLTPAALETFFRSGDQYVEHVFHVVRCHVDGGFVPGRVLDFGCGVGRLAIAFAKRSSEVVGVDIAPAMLELCRENAREAGVSNLATVVADDELSRVTGRFNFVNSYIVLQHIEPPRGIRLIQKLLGVLEPGGIASLQLTYGKSRRFWPHEAPKAEFYRRDGNLITDLLPVDDHRPAGSITMYDYDLNQVFAAATQAAAGHMVVLPTRDDDHLGLHLLFKKQS